jgi:hypothetical protein
MTVKIIPPETILLKEAHVVMQDTTMPIRQVSG